MSKKWLVVTALIIGAQSSLVENAFAGHWEEVLNPYLFDEGTEPWKAENALRMDGKVEINIPSTWGANTPEKVGTYNWSEIGEEAAGFAPYSYISYIGGAGGPGNVRSHGTRSSLFKWMPDYSGDNPPAILSLKVGLQAYAEILTIGSSSGTANSIETFVEDKAGSMSDDGNGFVSSDAQGTFLVHVATNGNEEVWSPPLKMDTKTLAYSSPGINQYINGYLSYSPQVDSRYVRLIRSGAATPKKKGASGVTIDEARDEWVDVDGTAYGHTRWSYLERVLPNANLIELTAGVWGYELYNDDEVVVNQVIEAVREGGWSQNLSFEWSPSTIGENIAAHSTDMPQGAGLYNPEGIDAEWIFTGDGAVHVTNKDMVDKGWYGTPTQQSPSFLSVTYNLTDNADGAKAKAKYFLYLHDEWENPTSLSETTRTGTWIIDGWSSHAGSGTDTKEWTYSQQHEVTLSSVFTANFKLKDWINFGGGVEKKSTFNANSAMSGSITLAAGQKARPYMRYTIRTDNKLVDRFVESGLDFNSSRTDGKWVQSKDKPINIPNDLEALWQGPFDINEQNIPDPT